MLQKASYPGGFCVVASFFMPGKMGDGGKLGRKEEENGKSFKK